MTVLALLLLGVQMRHYWPFMADDAFISLRYSQRLAEGKGLTWSDGQRVEGYSNLLWVLLCAAAGRAGVNLIAAARAMGVAGMLGTMLALLVHGARHGERGRRWTGAAVALLPFALSAPVAVWAIGGLEQPLLLLLLSWAMVVTIGVLETGLQGRGWTRGLAIAGVLLGGVTLTRADGFVLAGLVCLGTAAGVPRGRRRQALLLLGWVPAVVLAVQVMFRRWYYGEWVPNTALVKVSFTRHRLWTGLDYVGVSLLWEAGLLLLGVMGVYALGRRKGGAAIAGLIGCVAVGYAGYVVMIGGDIFPAARQLLPVLMTACVAAPYALDLLRHGGWWRRALVAGLVLSPALSREGATRAAEEHWEWQDKELALYLRATMPAGSLLVSEAAGALPYFSGLPAIDPLGLCDRHIAHHGSPWKGRAALGHELGDGRYVLDRRPAVIVFGPRGVAGVTLPGIREIVEDARFRDQYEERRVALGGPYPRTDVFYLRRGCCGATEPEKGTR